MSTRVLASPVRVADVLVSAVPGLRERLVEDDLRMSWPRIVGREWARQSRPAGLTSGTLEIVVDNSPLLHEMKLRSSDVLAAVQAFRPDTVSALRVRLGSRPPEKVAPPVTRSLAAPRLVADETRWIETMVAPVSDATVAASLRRLLTKDLLSHRMRGRTHRPDASTLHKDTA